MAPAMLQRVREAVLASLKWHSYIVYLDNIVIFTQSSDEHLARLEFVLEAIQTPGLKSAALRMGACAMSSTPTESYLAR